VEAPASAPASAPQAAPQAAPSADVTAAPGNRRITLVFDQESWVLVRARDGKVLISQLNPAGSELVVEGRPPFDVVIGNAAHVRVRYDDRDVDLAPHMKIDVARLKLE
jgi:cytoskeleton protein RodZ